MPKVVDAVLLFICLFIYLFIYYAYGSIKNIQLMQ